MILVAINLIGIDRRTNIDLMWAELNALIMRTVCLLLTHLYFSRYLSLIQILKQVLNYRFVFRRWWQMKGNILFNNPI